MGPTSIWSPTEDRRSYGVAKYPFVLNQVLNKSVHVVELDFGDALRIKGESQDWFYVKKKSTDEEGIVPKSYVLIQDCYVSRIDDETCVTPKWSSVVQEITSVLIEWHKMAKEYFLFHNPDLTVIRNKILELHKCRQRIMSANLTVEGLRELKKQVASIIDSGNHFLKLDMTVRDENGNALNSSITSTIEFYRQHQKATNILKKQRKGSQRKSTIVEHHSHSVLVTLERITWRVVDECEIRLFLYADVPPSTIGIIMSESAQFTLRAGEQPMSRFPIKFLFTDLGKRDIENRKIYLVGYIVRIGAMEYKDPDARRENTPFSQRSSQQIRRPWGIAVKEITHILKGPNGNEENVTVPYYPYGEQHEPMETALQKIIGIKDPGGGRENATLFCSVIKLSGTPAQIQEEQPLVLRGNPIIARKMGFPEVILPNDVRNDLYITLYRGEFHRGNKTTDKNVEVTVSTCNEKGEMLKGLIFGGSGSQGSDQYKSIVYYHDDKPKWNEIFKLNLPIKNEEFSKAHLKFTFKHRSSSETKDRQEKPFALAYIPLRNPDGTAISDDEHSLNVYKLDLRHYKENEAQYLYLPSTRKQNSAKIQCPQGFSLSAKDPFVVKTRLCSTKFTQNAHLLELLQWSTKLKNLAESSWKAKKSQAEQVESLLRELQQVLRKVIDVKGDEIVKFLPDVFDALFLILVDPIESIQSELRTVRHSLVIEPSLYEENLLIETCDRPVFECLIYIFGLILELKYQNFNSVLSLYIEDGFSSALAYKKLIRLLQWYVEKAEDKPQLDKVLTIMKSIEYFFKFIIRSFKMRMKMRDIRIGQAHDGAEDETDFIVSIENLFGAMSKLLRHKESKYLSAQGGCLKHIPSIIEELSTVIPPRKLSEHLVSLIVVIPPGTLTKQKLMTIKDIVHSCLFLDQHCRTMLVPVVSQCIQNHLPGNDDDMKRRNFENAKINSISKIGKIFGTDVIDSNPIKINHAVSTRSDETSECVDLLSDVMDILYRKDIGPTMENISYLMQLLLKPIICSIITIDYDDHLAGGMVAILLSLFRQMNDRHYAILIHNLKGDPNSLQPVKQELLQFLTDVLLVKKSLFSKPFFPPDWFEMILLQNSIVITTLKHFAGTIKKEYAEPFEEKPWDDFFKCAVSFMTQRSLQLEMFSPSKRKMIKERYGDMRLKAAEQLRVMWFSLGESKRVVFVPKMVGTFLDMTLVPEPELRASAIPIFFDMMRCEYDRSGSIKKVEDELTKKLVEFIENDKGDIAFREIFHDILTYMCENDTTGLKEMGLTMVRTVSKLLDLLLEYREVVHEDDPSNRMTCFVNLLDFSKEIDRKHLYLRYLYKLHDLHILSHNYTEAAFTLKLHSRQLDWVEDEIPIYLQSMRHSLMETQCELKEALYNDIIKHLVKSKMWECALEICDELRQQYAEESYNYTQLPVLLRDMATFYEEIMQKNRLNPSYFRVAFYGRGFPSFLQQKSYIYRGKDAERLPDFEARMLERYPHAELLRSLSAPSEEIMYSNRQLLQICDVKPVMGNPSNKRMSALRNADECVRRYYTSNDIEKFTYSRPYFCEPKEADNEFSSRWLDRHTLWTSQSFPGIMGWFPVVRETTTQIRPIVHAVEFLENANQEMRELIVLHCANPKENIGELSMKLNGILDAAVMGGIANYEKAFLTQSYLEKHPNDTDYVDKLKTAICLQVPILKEGLKIHKDKAAALLQMHEKLEICFSEFIKHIEKEYHVNPFELRDDKLKREIDRTVKKQLSKRRGDPPPVVQLAKDTARNSDSNTIANLRNSSAVLARSMGSFSSTVSLYATAPKMSGSKSMATITRQDAIRRSTQGSLAEVGEFFLPGSSATLPRNGGTYSTANTLSVHNESDSNISKSRDSSQGSMIALTQTLVTHRPLRSQVEQRKSQSWLTNGDNRHSGISVSSLSNNMSETSSRNSATIAEIDDDCGTASPPPLPPKQPKGESKPPTPPPKKPPLRHP
ncbi:unnamed protein product [Allacma fusca]|uniref:Dedicator of cytokinesis protein 1 n=1 Tax=Allacma fusca TaxID=39272 RepID=A0A8J2P8G9_9HEXA|nr:unnamed protein product [Allacma fusca]